MRHGDRGADGRRHDHARPGHEIGRADGDPAAAPLLGLAYLLNYVDRVNVGFAQLTMGPDLGLSAAAFGLGAGLFFIGYQASR